MEHVRNLAVVAVLLVAGSGLGLAVLDALRLQASGRLQRALLASGLGLGILGYVPFVLGLSGGLNGTALLSTLVAATAIGLYGWFRFLRSLNVLGRSLNVLGAERAGFDLRLDIKSRLGRIGPIGGLFLAFIVLLGLVNMLAALAPVIGVDELIYRVRLPQIYLDRGGFAYLPSIAVHQQPQHVQMLQMWAMGLGSDSATQVMQWAMGLLLVAAVVDLARRFVPLAVALAAGAVFYSISDVVVLSARAVPDLANGLFLFLAFVAFLRWMETDRDRWLVVVGILSGLFAVGSRLPGVYGPIGLAALVMLYAWRHPSRGLVGAVSAGAVVGVVALAVAVPWYAKSWVYAGNPFWPFFGSIFGVRDFTDAASAYLYSDQERDVGPWHSLSWIASAPWDLTMNPKRFRSGVIGPFILAVIPLFVVLKVERRIWWLAGGALLAVPLWYWTFVRLRSFLPVVALMTVVAAYLVWCLWCSGELQGLVRTGVRATVVASVGLWLLFGFGVAARFHVDSVLVTLGVTDEGEFLSERLAAADLNFLWYEDYVRLNELLPPGSYLLVSDTRSYYLDFDTERMFLLARRDPMPERMMDPQYVKGRVRELGSDYVVLWPQPRHGTAFEPAVWIEDSLHALCGQEWPVVYRSEKMIVCEVTLGSEGSRQ